MEWWHALLIILGSLTILMVLGFPTFLCFMVVNLLSVYLFWGGEKGIAQLILSLRDSVTDFYLVPLPLFILMGEVMFRSGFAPAMMDTLDKWLGRLPGRLSLLAVGGGTLFATMSGASVGSVAMLGSVLVPEMEKRGYKKPMILGPILGSGGLAVLIPPTALGVLCAAIGQFSVAKLLIAIIMPGLIMAAFFAIYIIIRAKLQPTLAPAYEVGHFSIQEKLLATARNVLPIGFIIFLVIGLIFLGVATPTEAAATGAAGCFILAAIQRKFTWKMVKSSLDGTTTITVMLFSILLGAVAFSQTLAFSGATKGLIEVAISLPIAPILVIAAIQVVAIIMGCFMEPGSILMIVIPISMPIVNAFGFDPVWFGVLMTVNVELAGITPPFGMTLFAMKGVSPPTTTMGEIYKAAFPYICINLLVLFLILVFPKVALWLPNLMR
jgi:tripartite ATP-independent transporter DctM subunit